MITGIAAPDGVQCDIPHCENFILIATLRSSCDSGWEFWRESDCENILNKVKILLDPGGR